MNQMLQLKGEFFQRNNNTRPGAPSLPNGKSVKTERLERLHQQLTTIYSFWLKEKFVDGALVSVKYAKVIAKSRRVSGFFSKGSQFANESIVGARFDYDETKKHVITHFVSLPIFLESIKRLTSAIRIMEDHFGESINSVQLQELNSYGINFKEYDTAKTHFMNIVVDSYFVEDFIVLENRIETANSNVVTIFKTNKDTQNMLSKIGIDLLPGKIVDETTILLNPDQITLLTSRAPYLISMATEDLSKLSKNDFFDVVDPRVFSIPQPTNEPIIGVIDTMFDKDVYFSDWVEFTNMLDESIELVSNDYIHGTSVSSIIVDGPNIDPDMDDGCGRFRVRHFGVANSGKFSSFLIMKFIEEIISSNRDIKVWNLSLGSYDEINENFISLEASILDRIQYEYDVIFVVAGTNKPSRREGDMRIGSPADSINSLVVNSVDTFDKPAVYSRRGIVLSFFNKPDLSFYGGTSERKLRVCAPMGERFVQGTSFAAPWISRKLAYLIEVLGFSREVAKAILIDSSASWEEYVDFSEASLIGHGVVKKHIRDIVESKEDEIRFILSSSSERYDTYNYNIPVPLDKNEYPYIAKVTLCYFPKCSRNQGVDYTNTELDVHFGRIDNNGKIKSINNNTQNIPFENHYLHETNARRLFRKWDNSKHIKEIVNTRGRSKKSYDNKMWGISVKTKERLESRDGEGLNFGVVVTLKEINGVNRIEDFIRQCSLRGWLVNRIDVENRIDIYNKANEEIEFD